ncbi:MAG: aminotransferase class I/II-fold pyridoxal phosphate-dependent enzyme, partial [Deinococcus sp.]|nr:aminotransferase class I/II-fold pyridoxal phosphate-dependent enzyme [Deinococcus sp.]
GREAALTFATGFMTNLGTIGTLVGRGEVILCDRENHASIIDACRLSFGTVRKFRHNDTADLERQLEATGDVGKFIVVDGVFSMSGDIVDLPGMLSVAKRYGARVMVDDAHSCGVLGENGRGTEEHHHLQGQTDLIMGTFSKSFASVGGFIAGPKEVVSFVKHQSRPFIFSAAASPAMVASALAALDIMEREPEHRERLWRNVRKVSTALRELGFDTQGSRTPIIPVLIGDDLAALHFWKRLFERGIFTTPALNPAVPEGRAIIRTSYTAAHSPEQLDRVIEAFALTGRETGVIA